jgi:hypothetical protein
MASAGVAAASGVTQGINIKEAADQNASLKRIQSQQVLQAGTIEAARVARDARSLAGSQRAALAANGVDPNAGTSLAIQEDTYAVAAEDAMMIRNNAARQAWGLQQEASVESELGKQSKFASVLGGFSTALTHGVQAQVYKKGLS